MLDGYQKARKHQTLRTLKTSYRHETDFVDCRLSVGLGAIKMAANPKIRRSVQHFIHLYRQMDDDMGL